MGGFMSGRYPSGSRPKANRVREFSLILDAPVLVKNYLIHGNQRRIRDLGLVCGGSFSHRIRGKIDVECQDTLVLHQQTGIRHRLELGSARLEYTWIRPGEQVISDIVLVAGMTTLNIIHWGFKCPQCERYRRKLFLPVTRQNFLCRTCHGLRYVSQQRLDRLSVRLGDKWGTQERLMGIPPEKFWQHMQRAGQYGLRWQLPQWVNDEILAGFKKPE